MDLESISILDIANRDVKVATSEQNIFDISKVMLDNNIGSVVIIEDDNNENRKPVGIITERDLVRILGSMQLINLQVPIKEIMSKPVVTLSSKASIIDAMKLMYEKKIRRVVVVDSSSSKEYNKMIGIVTEHDIFRIVMSNRDLLTSILDSQFPIPQSQTYEEFSRFWFSNSFFR